MRREAQPRWGWGIVPSQWKTVSAKLSAQPPRGKLLPGTRLWLSTGSKEGHIIAQLRLLPPGMSAEAGAEEVKTADKQLAVDAVELVGTGLPVGRGATGTPNPPPPQRSAAGQTEQQSSLPVAQPQLPAAVAASVADLSGAGKHTSLSVRRCRKVVCRSCWLGLQPR